MIPLLKKELNAYFSSPVAYLIIGVFLLVNGLFLWIFNDELNIINTGYADLNNFFFLAPWILLFLVPAITMKTLADEFHSGTIEILKTLPISYWQIILGKYLAALSLVCMAIIPTLIYAYSVNQLGSPTGNLDHGSTIGSYLGLLLLASAYTSIGVFSSSISNNQTVAFVLGIMTTFFFYYGFDAIADVLKGNTYTLKLFGMREHFKSIQKGVVDTRDITYFSSLIAFFLFVAKQRLADGQ